jgi:hypothetical protein
MGKMQRVLALVENIKPGATAAFTEECQAFGSSGEDELSERAPKFYSYLASSFGEQFFEQGWVDLVGLIPSENKKTALQQQRAAAEAAGQAAADAANSGLPAGGTAANLFGFTAPKHLDTSRPGSPTSDLASSNGGSPTKAGVASETEEDEGEEGDDSSEEEEEEEEEEAGAKKEDLLTKQHDPDNVAFADLVERLAASTLNNASDDMWALEPLRQTALQRCIAYATGLVEDGEVRDTPTSRYHSSVGGRRACPTAAL